MRNLVYRTATAACLLVIACGSDDASGGGGGSGGQGAGGGVAGSSGASGGAAATSGSAGNGATAGTAGSAGSSGGSAGTAGSGGVSGTGGAAGTGGVAGGTGVATCALEFGSQVCSATVDPTTLGVGIDPVVVGIPQAAGKHFFCYPQNAASHNGKLVVHLVGTSSNPSKDNSFVLRACSLGFAAVAPMYKNKNAVRTVCKNDGPCYAAFHQEIIYGDSVAPNPVVVDKANTFESRLDTLLTHLSATETVFPAWTTHAAKLKASDLSAVVLSGHSQGSGHALYIARDFAAERAVLLAGPADRTFSGLASNAAVPWISSLTTQPPKTAPAKIYAYIHEDDSVEVVAQVKDNWDKVGVAPTSCNFSSSASPGYPKSCRRVLIPKAGCGGVVAHLTVDVRKFSNSCTPGVGTNTNEYTWGFLLTN